LITSNEKQADLLLLRSESDTRFNKRDGKMNPSFHQGSAKIYQFPVGGRASLGIHRNDTASVADTPRVTETICGSGWYHEAAIEDAKRTDEH
jgi:Protein of unknown function (DUF2735)